MAHYDWFVGRLQCAHCGTISPEDASTGLHTYLRDTDDYAPEAYLGVGDALGEIDFLQFD